MMTGGCLCGAIRYRAEGKPEFQGLCHCRDCQKLSGGGHVGFMCFPLEAVKVEGEVLVHHGKGGSGVPADRHYCPSCFSPLFGASQMMPGKINIYAGSLDDLGQFKPEIAIFTRSRQPWDDGSRNLKCFATIPGA